MAVAFAKYLIFLAQAVTTADLCEEPVDYDSKSPSPYCVITKETPVETSYYEITLQPTVVAMISKEGRALEVLSSVRQSPIGFDLEVHPAGSEQMERVLAYHRCPELNLIPGSIFRCERSDGDYYWRLYAAGTGEDVVLLAYRTGPRANAVPGEEEKYQRMFDSLRIKFEELGN